MLDQGYGVTKEKQKMEAFKALGHSLILFLFPLIISVKKLLTPVWERVVCHVRCIPKFAKKSPKQAFFSGALFAGDISEIAPFEQILLQFLALFSIVFLMGLLLKIVRQSYANWQLLKAREKTKNYFSFAKKIQKRLANNFSTKASHNLVLASKKKRQKLSLARHSQEHSIFINGKHSTLAIATILLLAITAYTLPERYQLANLFRPADTQLAFLPSSATQSPAVQGEATENETIATLKETNPTLYTLLQPEKNSGENLKLGGMLLTPQGELFITSGTVVSDSLKRHTIKSINLGTGAVTSRIIDNGTIQSQDLADNLVLGKLNLEQLIIGSKSPSHFSMRKGDLFVSNRLEVDSDAYFDKTIYVRDSSSISVMTSNTLQTNTANISNILSNSNLHIKGRLPDEDTFHLHDFTDLFLYPSGATIIGQATVPSFSHIDGQNDLYIQDDLEVGGVIYGTISGAFSPSGNLDMDTNIITNIGNANTDFTSTGGLNLADNLNVNNQFFVNAASGNVGIGTTGPNAQLNIAGANKALASGGN